MHSATPLGPLWCCNYKSWFKMSILFKWVCIPFLKNQTRLLKKLQEIYLWHVPQTFVISKTVHIYKQLQIISISHTFRKQVLSSFSQHIWSRQLWYSTVVVWRPFGCNFLNAQSLILLATGFKDNPNTPYL